MDDVIVVTGHEAPSVAAAVAGSASGWPTTTTMPPGWERRWPGAWRPSPSDIDGALICLGDMPHVRPDTVRRIVAAFRPSEGADIRVPVHRGRRGHPVLFGRRLFGELRALTGDTGARALMETFQAHVVEVPVDDGGILKDYDTPEDFRGAAAAGPKAVTG